MAELGIKNPIKRRQSWASFHTQASQGCFPSSTCNWTTTHAECCSVFYSEGGGKVPDMPDCHCDSEAGDGKSGSCATERWFFRELAKILSKKGQWDKLETYITNSSELFADHLCDLDVNNDSLECLYEVFEQDQRLLTDEEQRVLSSVLRKVELLGPILATSRAKALISESTKEYESLGKVVTFLNVLKQTLLGIDISRPPNKGMFVNVFQRYADLCGLTLMPGSSSERTMNIMGACVKSRPDMQYGMYSGDKLLVITVGEFKRFGNMVEEQDVRMPRSNRGLPQINEDTDEDLSGQSLLKRCKLSDVKEEAATVTLPSLEEEAGRSSSNIDPNSACELDSQLCGQHAVELLLELPFSALQKLGNKNCMFGLIVQATKVRMTCLHMTEMHLQKLQQDTAQSLEEEKATVYYSRPYDLLNHHDRRHIDYILLTLSYLSDQ